MRDLLARSDSRIAALRAKQRPWLMKLNGVDIGRNATLPAAIRAINQPRNRRTGRAAVVNTDTGETWIRTSGTHWECVQIPTTRDETTQGDEGNKPTTED